MALYVGLALGDLRGDQDLDVMASDKWYERPADPIVQDWSGRTVFADPVQNVYCHDVNGDNRLDVVAAEGFKHPDGRIMWAEAPAAPKTELWTVHVVAQDLDGPENIWAGALDDDGDTGIVSARINPVDIDGDGDGDVDFTADGNAENHIYLWVNGTRPFDVRRLFLPLIYR